MLSNLPKAIQLAGAESEALEPHLPLVRHSLPSETNIRVK